MSGAVRGDEDFAGHSLSQAEINDLRRWAQEWGDNIHMRRYPENP